MKNHPNENRYCPCKGCGKELHFEVAKFCGHCGEKLGEEKAGE